MATVPVLILGFNRPARVADLIDSLRVSRPAAVCLAVDGPRPTHPGDQAKVEATRAAAELIDWTDNVSTLFRETNLGLEVAVPTAVSWVLERHESVIVIEDDVDVGPQFVEFATAALERFEARSDIFHVSGYNVVPTELQSNSSSPARLSRVPESFAWATWRRAWRHYDPTLAWGSKCSVNELSNVLGSKIAGLRWKQNFSLARHGRISSWAYRWAASMWEHQGLCLSPNRNLISYRGYAGGTHTRTAARWTEFPIEPINLDDLDASVAFDAAADEYLHRQVFRASITGVALGPAEAFALEMIRRRSQRARRRV